MKKVLFVIESLGGGGAEKILTTIVKHLDKTKFDITVLLVVETGVHLEEVKQYCKVKAMLPEYSTLNNLIDKIKYKLEYKFIYTAQTRLVYTRYVKEKYDVEIAFVEGYATKFVAASTNFKSKKVAWVHTDLERNSYADKYYKNEEQHLKNYQKFERVLCVSDSVKEAFENKLFTSEKVLVQYNPIDEKEIQNKSRQKINKDYPKQGLLLGTMGRLVHQKGYIRLVKCVKKLSDKGYKFTIWIMGDGEEKEQLEQYIKQNKLEQKVVLLGFQNNPYQYLRCCDAFICSSYAEGFSTAATESIILGKPVFTVECAGMRELMSECQCGEIVSNTDEALYLLLKNLVEGKYDMKKYQLAAKEKSKGLSLKLRIMEIEKIMLS